ncbi:MAG: sugar phosphate isomerase/epimerase family protein [Bryobacterales bacterium]|nr:sugar phosphate isomerase/epimerase [Bryobacteraceae bacterium]MDW8129328.1 sugar phosphate isomerase/epimerase family protein [Bryobacterales bacterium]
MRRRDFLALSAAAPALAAGRLPVRKGILMGMLPKNLSYAERCKLAREAGFEELEVGTIEDPAEAAEIGKAAEAAGLRIHSVMNQAHWKYPLSSADPAVVERSIKGMETSFENARVWGADVVLLVPAVVNAETGYREAWERSQRQIRRLLPLAEKHKIVIAVENVWNRFLLSPLEFARYVDEFQSPWVRAYFDVGNVVLFGFPEDWIRTLGHRIVRVHFKDFRFRKRVAEFVNLGEGDVNWPAVHRALAEIGYKGPATLELPGGDAEYLKDLSRRMDRILEGGQNVSGGAAA